MHIGLAERERVDVLAVVEVRERVVHEAVRDLVRAHGVDHVLHRRVGREPPVILRDLGRRVVCPPRDATRLEILDAASATGTMRVYVRDAKIKYR